jgi:hypothetical protein
MKKKLFVLFLTICSGIAIYTVQPETEFPIPRSDKTDKNSYTLLEAQRNGDIVTALYIAFGPDWPRGLYTRMEVNCENHEVRYLGLGPNSEDNIREISGDWFPPTPGGAREDVAAFACRLEEKDLQQMADDS